MSEIKIFKDGDELSRSFAAWLINDIKLKLEQQERYTLVLSGGSTPQKLFKLLAAEYKDAVSWNKVHFFWGDERFVPADDERNNAKVAIELLLSKIEVPQDNIHPFNTALSPQEAEDAYTGILARYFEGQRFTFDTVLLGMGGDAHTLSLFPGYEVIKEELKWVDHFFLKEQDMYRITLTAHVVNKAANIVFLVSGADKATSLQAVLKGEKNVMKYPSQAIHPSTGKISWWIDEAAAAAL